MPAPAATRPYRQTVHYLQHKTSARQAITDADRHLTAAYAAITEGCPSVGLLEKARASVEIALREARGMANMDDAAPMEDQSVA